MLELFRKYLNEQSSPQEVKELLAWFSAENESALRVFITASMEDMDAEDKVEERRWNTVTDKIFAAIKTQMNSKKGKARTGNYIRVRQTV